MLTEIGCESDVDIDVFLLMDPASCNFGGESAPNYRDGSVFKGLSAMASNIKSHFFPKKHDKDNTCTTILVIPPEGCGAEKEVRSVAPLGVLHPNLILNTNLLPPHPPKGDHRCNVCRCFRRVRSRCHCHR